MHGLAMASSQSAELGPPLAHLSNLQESEESGFTLRSILDLYWLKMLEGSVM